MEAAAATAPARAAPTPTPLGGTRPIEQGPDGSARDDREVMILLAVAVVGGIVVGLAVAGIHEVVAFLQTLLFTRPIDGEGLEGVPVWRLVAVPVVGTLVLGLLLVVLQRAKRLGVTDPVEANALKGGRMSARESATLVGLSIVSIAIGGSVGFEAAMTQLGAGTLSVTGQRLKLSRSALRILVSCGTAAGIAAIFNAPLTGTLYALELVVGGYAVRALLPTLLAAGGSGLVTHVLFGYQPLFQIGPVGGLAYWHYLMAIGGGVVCALVGIAVMRGCTGLEHVLARFKVPPLLRPVVGGIGLAACALATPFVMGPGHLAIRDLMHNTPGLIPLLILVVAKGCASVLCVGSGFRGGLFSASLLLGAALGALFHAAVLVPVFGPGVDVGLSVVVGMTATSAAIIGTPIAIVLLAVETTGLHAGIVSVAFAVVVASHLTRRWFGYSFSTWRFHIRGHDLTGPRDIGRLRALTFADAPLEDPPRVPAEARLSEAAAMVANAAPSVVLAVENADGTFDGFLRRDRLLEAALATPDLPTGMIAEKPSRTAHMTDSLMNHLESGKTAIVGRLAVVSPEGRLVGFAREADVLRRYLDEVEAADRDDTAVGYDR